VPGDEPFDTEEKKGYSSPVSNPGCGKFMAYLIDGASTPNTVNSSVARTREYLTGKEVEKLMEAARKSSGTGIATPP
jgi:hypothetical protein